MDLPIWQENVPFQKPTLAAAPGDAPRPGSAGIAGHEPSRADHRPSGKPRRWPTHQSTCRRSPTVAGRPVRSPDGQSKAQVAAPHQSTFDEPLAPESEAWSNTEASLLTSSALPIKRESMARRSKSCSSGAGRSHDGSAGLSSLAEIGATKR